MAAPTTGRCTASSIATGTRGRGRAFPQISASRKSCVGTSGASSESSSETNGRSAGLDHRAPPTAARRRSRASRFRRLRRRQHARRHCAGRAVLPSSTRRGLRGRRTGRRSHQFRRGPVSSNARLREIAIHALRPRTRPQGKTSPEPGRSGLLERADSELLARPPRVAPRWVDLE